MRIQDWPAEERPREKLLKHGSSTLSDAELLALFLGSGLPGQDAVSTARQLLARHGPLRRLLENPPKALAKLPGIGPARACLIAGALELCSRHLAAELARGAPLTRPESAGRYFLQRLRHRQREVFAALFLDNRHRALAFEELFTGSLTEARVHPREVVRRALAHNAAAVIVGHNHPSGEATPSQSDQELTRQLANALALIEVRLLDHFIIADGPPLSMAARGLM